MEKNYLFSRQHYSLYTPKAGCGYLKQTSSMPVRTLYPELIVQGENGVLMPPCPEHACSWHLQFSGRKSYSHHNSA